MGDGRMNQDLNTSLDFVNVPDDRLLRLFYKREQQYHHTYDKQTGELVLPPQAYRCTSSQIRKFFRMGPKNKKAIVAQYPKNRNLTVILPHHLPHLQSQNPS